MNDQKLYDFPAGEVLAFDKPPAWTSFNLVKSVRNQLSRRLGIKKLKVGHAGTLDPLATGVMILCTGRATKEIDRLQAGTKEYVATLRLGCTTASFDAEHPIDAIYPTAHITEAEVRRVLATFVGSIRQVPPAYSACKVEGRRAFDMARDGETVELRAKELVIDEIELLDVHLPQQGVVSPDAAAVESQALEAVSIKREGSRKQLVEDAESMSGAVGSSALRDGSHVDTTVTPTVGAAGHFKPEVFAYVTIRVVCSKGTYIRALARDIGRALGSGAYLIALRRTRVGDITVDDCMQVGDIEQWVAGVRLAPVVVQ